MTIENLDDKVVRIRAEGSSPTKGALDLIAEQWAVVAFLACALMLGAAHAFETFGKLAPCLLCLKQREVYWVTGSVALAGIVLSRTPFADRVRKPLILLLGIGFLYGAGVAVYHAGAEWKFWPGPAACAAAGAKATAGDLAALLKGAKIAAPSCDKAVWIFLGLSMAGWNALISLGLAIASFFAALRPKAA